MEIPKNYPKKYIARKIVKSFKKESCLVLKARVWNNFLVTKIELKQEGHKIRREVCFSFLFLWDFSVSISKVKALMYLLL